MTFASNNVTFRASRLSQLHRHLQPYLGSLAGRGLPTTASSDFFQTFAHVQQSIPCPWTPLDGLNRCPLTVTVQFKPTPVVAYDEHEPACQEFQGNPNFRCAPMLDGIVECFLKRKKHVVPNLSSQRPARQMEWNVQPAANPGRAEEVLGKASKIRHQAVQAVMPRIDRPNDF